MGTAAGIFEKPRPALLPVTAKRLFDNFDMGVVT